MLHVYVQCATYILSDCVKQNVLCLPHQDSLVFVVGKMDGLMVVSGRRHNADDVVATALAVEPMKFVYRGR